MSLEEIYSQPRAATIVRPPTLTRHQNGFAVLGQHLFCFMRVLVMYPCNECCAFKCTLKAQVNAQACH